MKKIKNIGSLVAVSVALITFFVYLPGLQNDFVGWDDGVYVTDNSAIQILDMRFLRWAFLEFHASNWHPLTWISHAIDYAFWGLNPVGHHLTNNILHSINTFLVVLLVVRLLEVANASGGRAQDPPLQFSSRFTIHESRSVVDHSRFTIHDSLFMLIAAAVTGLLFGLHPLHGRILFLFSSSSSPL